MTRLVLFLGSMIGSTLAFVFVVVALVAGHQDALAADRGGRGGLRSSPGPIAWVVAKRMR